MPAYGAGPYLPAIVMERPVYVREMSDGLYTPFTYLLYKVHTLPSHRKNIASNHSRNIGEVKLMIDQHYDLHLTPGMQGIFWYKIFSHASLS